MRVSFSYQDIRGKAACGVQWAGLQALVLKSCRNVWHLRCYLPSNDASELITEVSSSDHEGLNAGIFQATGNSLESCVTLEKDLD